MANVGILGAGFMGEMHSTVYSQLPDVKIVGIADIRGEKAKSLARKFKTIPYFDPEQILKKPDIQIVDVCLPTFLHKEYVIKAAENKKDVICEKPIALTVEDANEMIKVCKENNVKFMVAQVIRFWPEYKFLKDAYDSKRYGDLKLISMRRLSPLPTWGWENWLLSQEKSGGALVDLHIHDTDFLLYLLGEKPKKIFSKIVKNYNNDANVLTTFTFGNGIVAHADGEWDFPPSFPFEMSYIAKFEKGTIEFNSRNTPTVVAYGANGNVERPTFEKIKVEGIEGNIEDMGGYFYELRYFIDHVIHNKPFQVVTPEDARDSLYVVLKEKESAEKGQEIIL
ncbi:MAG TPA: Gfo/Idh/MocA family oxidoreductase [Candidatus Ratteibacteria bacterium]|nr:Gfo/Idh/MocA family oxidoreductase [bacterium]HRR95530.1 Gfo/Idh/MocA family oxidoreductase [Candidatus Ratteibacteria bacterium]